MKIKNGIVVGIGKAPIKCAGLLKENGIHVSVIEPVMRNFSCMESLCRLQGIEYRKMSEDTAGYLECLPENTLIVSVCNNYVFSKKTLSRPNVFAINYHNALLPRHRGMNAEAWSIYEQNKESGVTWHKIEDGIDTGEILYQKRLEIGSDETSLQLLNRQTKLAYDIFEANIEDIIHWCIKRHKQTGDSSYHGIKDVPSNGRLSVDWNCDKTYAFLRAMDYGPIHTLGRPQMNVNGTVYVWDKYIVEGTQENKKGSNLVDNKIVLDYGSTRISLMNIQPVNDNHDV